jgi:hypothetical protein
MCKAPGFGRQGGKVPLACFASRTSSSISGAKAKNLTLRHPMNNSHVADPIQRPVLDQDKSHRSERKARSKLM